MCCHRGEVQGRRATTGRELRQPEAGAPAVEATRAQSVLAREGLDAQPAVRAVVEHAAGFFGGPGVLRGLRHLVASASGKRATLTGRRVRSSAEWGAVGRTVTPGPSPRHPTETAFGIESCMDELCALGGFDRWQFRWDNALTEGRTIATGQTLTAGVGVRKCLEALKERFHQAKIAG